MNTLSTHNAPAQLERRVLLSAVGTHSFQTNFNTFFAEGSIPEFGTLVSLSSSNASIIDASNKTFSYNPPTDFAGMVHFTAVIDQAIDYYGTGGVPPELVEYDIAMNVYLSAPMAEPDHLYDYTDPQTNEVYTDINYFVLKDNVLSISAENGVLHNDEDFRDGPSWLNLTAHQITDQSPGASQYPNGSPMPQFGTVSLSGNGAFTYTPFASAFADPNFSGGTDSFYYYADNGFNGESGVVRVDVDLVELYIMRNGQDVDQNPALLDVWVGEKIAVSVGSRGEFPAIPGLATFQWSVGPGAIDGYTGYGENDVDADPDGLSVGKKLLLTSAELKNPSIDFYWIKDGTRIVSVEVQAIGQTQSDEASFSVDRPSQDVIATATNLEFGEDNSEPGVHLSGVGARFEAEPDFVSPGSNRWTQVITSDVVSWRENGGDLQTSHRLAGVDNRVDFTDELVATDSPWLGNSGPSYTEVQRHFSAKMYLMWRHSSTDSIWIPINVTSWSFDFAIKKVQGQWQFDGTPEPPTVNQPYDTYTFPEWIRVYNNTDPWITD